MGTILSGGSGDSSERNNSGCLAILFMAGILGFLVVLAKWYRSILGIIGVMLYPSMWDYFHDFGFGYKGILMVGSLGVLTFISALIFMVLKKGVIHNILLFFLFINFVILIGRLLYYIISYVF